jgi:hypothetical protein
MPSVRPTVDVISGLNRCDVISGTRLFAARRLAPAGYMKISVEEKSARNVST